MGRRLWARDTILSPPWDAWNAPPLGEPGVVYKGRGRWVILGCLHYYPFDSGWRRGWRDYVTELRDSEAKLYFYHLSKYLWGLNDGLEVKNTQLQLPSPQESTISEVSQIAGLNPDSTLPLTHFVVLGRLSNRSPTSVLSSLKGR